MNGVNGTESSMRLEVTMGHNTNKDEDWRQVYILSSKIQSGQMIGAEFESEMSQISSNVKFNWAVHIIKTSDGQHTSVFHNTYFIIGVMMNFCR